MQTQAGASLCQDFTRHLKDVAAILKGREGKKGMFTAIFSQRLLHDSTTHWRAAAVKKLFRKGSRNPVIKWQFAFYNASSPLWTFGNICAGSWSEIEVCGLHEIGNPPRATFISVDGWMVWIKANKGATKSFRTVEQRRKEQQKVCCVQPEDAQIASGKKQGLEGLGQSMWKKTGDEPKAVKTHNLICVNGTWCQCCTESGIIAREERRYFYMGSIILGIFF